MKYLVVFLTVVASVLLGCSQQTKSDPTLLTDTRQVGTQDQAAQGSSSHVNVYITNGENYKGKDRSSDGTAEAGTLDASTAGPDANSTGRAAATFVQSGLTINIHTGGSSTGAQSATGPGPQTSSPGSTVTQTPTQTPSASLAVPISVAMPGGAASGSASAAGPQGTATLTADQRASLTNLMQKALQGDGTAFAELVKILPDLKVPPVTEAPKSNP